MTILNGICKCCKMQIVTKNKSAFYCKNCSYHHKDIYNSFYGKLLIFKKSLIEKISDFKFNYHKK